MTFFGESCPESREGAGAGLCSWLTLPPRSIHWAACCGTAQQGKINDSHFHRKKCNFQSHSNCPFNSFKPSVTKCLTLTHQLLMLQAGPPTHPSWNLHLCIPESPRIRGGMLARRWTVKYKILDMREVLLTALHQDRVSLKIQKCVLFTLIWVPGLFLYTFR